MLIQVDKFYFLVDFIILNTQSITHANTPILVILGTPFLDTSNAMINCKSGIMKLTFRNMTIEVNFFNIGKQSDRENDDIHEVNMIQRFVEGNLFILCFLIL